MSTLYLIGGSPRSGKTIIFDEFIRQNPMIAISSDALREAARYVLTDEPFVTISDLSFEGHATFHRAEEKSDISHTKHFSQKIDQEYLAWKTIVGLINYYDRKEGNPSLAIEGIAITPERVKSLSLKNMTLKAVFVGFTDASYLDSILEFAHAKKDWVYTKMMIENTGDESVIRKWFDEELQNNKAVEARAREYGHRFFSVNGSDFKGYCDSVVKYLLS